MQISNPSESFSQMLINQIYELTGHITGSSRQIDSLLSQLQDSSTNKSLITKLVTALEMQSKQCGKFLDTRSAAIKAQNLIHCKLTGSSKNTANKTIKEIYDISFLGMHKTKLTPLLAAASALTTTAYLATILFTSKGPWYRVPLTWIEKTTSDIGQKNASFWVTATLRSSLLALITPTSFFRSHRDDVQHNRGNVQHRYDSLLTVDQMKRIGWVAAAGLAWTTMHP